MIQNATMKKLSKAAKNSVTHVQVYINFNPAIPMTFIKTNKIRYFLKMKPFLYSAPVSEETDSKVQVPPEFVYLFIEGVIDPGQGYTLVCLAKGNPEPEFEWFFYGKKIESSGNEASPFKIQTSTLENGDVLSRLTIEKAAYKVSRYIAFIHDAIMTFLMYK